jgi:hypothetical protein
MNLKIESAVLTKDENGDPERLTIVGELTHPVHGVKTWRQHISGDKLTAYVNAPAQQKVNVVKGFVASEVVKREEEWARQAATPAPVVEDALIGDVVVE